MTPSLDNPTGNPPDLAAFDLEAGWPPIIAELPDADTRIPGLRGRILKGGDTWVMFMAADREVHVPTHAHGTQWGLVIAGSMELWIDGRVTTYRRGDTHHIPEHVEHSAVLHSGWKGIYLFQREHPAEPNADASSNNPSAGRNPQT